MSSSKVPYPLVLVEWKDHYTHDAWAEKDRLPTAPEMCLTVGWLVKEDDQTMVVTSCLDPTNAADGLMGGTWIILKNCVTSRKVLKKGYEKRKAKADLPGVD
jgi:hypothetical protein